MADRLTQLQDAVNEQANNFTNSLGILQQSAARASFPGLSSSNPAPGAVAAAQEGKPGVNGAAPAGEGQPQPQQQHEDHTNLFSQLISRTAKDIEQLIDSLPSEESSADLQANSLRKLEEENAEAADKLAEAVKQGEAILKEIQSALHDIAQAQLEIQKLEGNRQLA